MKALIFLVQISFTILLSIFILRAILQIVRGNFRNPVAQAIMRITNPLILPLRKFLPPLGKIDTATIVSCILIVVAMNTVLISISAYPLTTFAQQELGFIKALFLRLLITIINLYWLLILFTILISWMQPQQHSPLTAFLSDVTEPILAPARRLIKPVGGLDLSPIPILLILSALQYQFSNLI